MPERLTSDIAADLRRQTDLSDATNALLHEAADKLEGLINLIAAAENARDEARDQVNALAPVGRMYLDAVDADPELELVTLGQAYAISEVAAAVEAWETTTKTVEHGQSPPTGKEIN